MKKKGIISCAFAVLFIWLAVALKLVDVRSIGPNESLVGLAGINSAVFGAFGWNELWDKITDGLLLISLATIGGFVLMGFYQLIKRKKLAKVDCEIFALSGLYAATIVLYVLFEKVVINCRPILEDDGSLEASFPSTHTLLSCIAMGGALILADKYIKNKTARLVVKIICVCLAILTPIGRIFAGKHWLTDVLGGYLLSGALLAAFACVLDALRVKRKKSKD